MKIGIIGVTGNLGTLVAEEALRRSIAVVGIAPEKYMKKTNDDVEYRLGDATDLASLSTALTGVDVAVSVFPPTVEHPEAYHQEITNVIDACKLANVPRLVAVVGSSAAIVNTGHRLVESDYFQETTRHFYLAICDTVSIYLNEHDLDWTMVTPAAKMTRSITDKRRKYRTGTTDLVVTDQKSMRYFDVSQISYFDFAYAIVDEIQAHTHPQGRMTFGY